MSDIERVGNPRSLKEGLMSDTEMVGHPRSLRASCATRRVGNQRSYLNEEL